MWLWCMKQLHQPEFQLWLSEIQDISAYIEGMASQGIYNIHIHLWMRYMIYTYNIYIYILFVYLLYIYIYLYLYILSHLQAKLLICTATGASSASLQRPRPSWPGGRQGGKKKNPKQVGWCRKKGLPSLKLTYLAGISPCLIGNTSSIRVHFPASYVRLPECNSWRNKWLLKWFVKPDWHNPPQKKQIKLNVCVNLMGGKSH